MKTKYRPSRKSFKPSREITGLIILVVILILFSYVSILRDSVMNSYSHSAWFVRTFTLTTFQKVFYPWDETRTTNFSSTTQNAEIQILKKENEDLKSALGRKPSIHTTLARVLTKPPQAPYDVLLIDVGIDEGIFDGGQIYDENGSLIGVVLAASPHFSKVQLFSSPGVSTEAELSRKGSVLSLIGLGDGSFTVQVPRDFDIREGDVFVLPGIKSKALATVIEIKGNAESSFKVVYAKGFFEPRTLTWVTVESRN